MAERLLTFQDWLKGGNLKGLKPGDALLPEVEATA